RCFTRERDAAGDGASYPGTHDGNDHFNDLEERSGFRRQRIESASSLSVSGEDPFPSPAILSGGGRSGSRDARFEGEYQLSRLGPVCFGTESLLLRYAPSDNQK